MMGPFMVSVQLNCVCVNNGITQLWWSFTGVCLKGRPGAALDEIFLSGM